MSRYEYTRRSSAMRGMLRNLRKTYHAEPNFRAYNPTIWKNTQTGKYTFTVTQTGYTIYRSTRTFKLVK